MGIYLAGVKQELSQSGYLYGYANEEASTMKSTWSHALQVSSPISCVTSQSSNLLDFSSGQVEGRRLQMDHNEVEFSIFPSSLFIFTKNYPKRVHELSSIDGLIPSCIHSPVQQRIRRRRSQEGENPTFSLG